MLIVPLDKHSLATISWHKAHLHSSLFQAEYTTVFSFPKLSNPNECDHSRVSDHLWLLSVDAVGLLWSSHCTAWSPSCTWWPEQWSSPPAPARFHLKGVLCTILTELQTVFWLFPQCQGHLKDFSVFCYLRPYSNTGNLNIFSSMMMEAHKWGWWTCLKKALCVSCLRLKKSCW